MKEKPAFIANEKGFSTVVVAAFMLMAVFLLGLAIDAGYLYVVKGELQNAADAGALAGAGVIYPSESSEFPPPAFAKAHDVARSFIKSNKAAGEMLQPDNIEAAEPGYWNLDGTPATMQTPAIEPAGRCSGAGGGCTKDSDCPLTETCLMRDVAAVLVTVRKSVPTFFCAAFGLDSFQLRASAVAARGYPTTGNHPFPMAVSKCMVKHYFSQNPLPNPPANVFIFDAYGPLGSACYTGQWTSFAMGSNSTDDIRTLMYGEPTPLNVGDRIHISVGNKEILFNLIEQDFVGKVVQMPVVDDPLLNMNMDTPVTGFVRFYIEEVIPPPPGRVESRIKGHFLSYYADAETSHPGGSKGNSITPPVLVK